MKNIITLVTFLIISGCAAVGVENVKKLDSGQKITVISLMGDEFIIKTIGTTVFQNSEKRINVGDWGIDKYLENESVNSGNETSRFKFIPIDMTSIRSKPGKVKNNSWDNNLVFQNGKGFIQDIVKQQNVDLLVVIAPQVTSDQFFNTNQYVAGYGVYQRSFFGVNNAVNYTILQMALIETKTGNQIARTHLSEGSAREKEAWLDTETIVKNDVDKTKSDSMALMKKLVLLGLKNLELIK